MRDKKSELTITRMVWVIAFGSPDSFVIDPKVYERKFKATYQSFGTMTIPATKTTPIGLPADARVVMVFAPDSYREPSGQLYRDTEILPVYRSR